MRVNLRQWIDTAFADPGYPYVRFVETYGVDNLEPSDSVYNADYCFTTRDYNRIAQRW